VILEAEANYGGNKSNHFLDRRYDMTLSVERTNLHHKIVVSYVDRTPEGYLGGRHYTCYLRFYYPVGATAGKMTGLNSLPTDEAVPQFQMLSGTFQITVNLSTGRGTNVVTIEYDTPAGDMQQGHTIYWQKQAGTLSDPVAISYVINGKTFRTNTDLSQDRVLTLSGEGMAIAAGHTGTAGIPLLGS